MDIEQIIDSLNWDEITGGRTQSRENAILRSLLNGTITNVSALRLEECNDEKTGRRYGNAQVRRGCAQKIGGGGRNKGSRYAYQVWAVWN